jgi:hypothetical protein
MDGEKRGEQNEKETLKIQMINEESSAKSLFGQTHGACLNRQFKETYFLTMLF